MSWVLAASHPSSCPRAFALVPALPEAHFPSLASSPACLPGPSQGVSTTPRWGSMSQHWLRLRWHWVRSLSLVYHVNRPAPSFSTLKVRESRRLDTSPFLVHPKFSSPSTLHGTALAFHKHLPTG